MHQQKLTIKLATTAVIAALVLAFGIVWSGTGLASVGNSDTDSAAMAQNGKGNGNGNQGQGNGNGQGAGAENQGNGNGNNGQGNGNGNQGNGQGVGAENQDNGAENQGNGQGNGNNGQGQGVEVQAQDEGETEAADDDTAEDEAAQPAEQSQAGKVSICHSTGNGDGVFITVSQNAVDAHENHGDDTEGVTSEADCEASNAGFAQQGGLAATPGTGEEATGPAAATSATPAASDMSEDEDEEATPQAAGASPEAEEATPPGV